MNEYTTPKKMKSIGDLFDKYKKTLKAPQTSVEKECARVIVEVTGLAVSANQVVYTVATRTISLRLPSILKSEIRFRESKILQLLETRLGRDGCPKAIL